MVCNAVNRGNPAAVDLPSNQEKVPTGINVVRPSIEAVASVCSVRKCYLQPRHEEVERLLQLFAEWEAYDAPRTTSTVLSLGRATG